MRPYRCHVTAIRAGEEEPCDKPAVGYLDPMPWEDEEFGPCDPYPACAYHLNASGGRAIALDRIHHNEPERRTP